MRRASFSNISALIKKYRKKTPWSQEELGVMLGLENSRGQMISNIERGKCGLPTKHALPICVHLKIPPALLADTIAKDYRDSVMDEIQVRLLRG